MPEARDRLSRQDDAISPYRRRRISRTSNINSGRRDSVFFILEDENEEQQFAVTTIRWRGTGMVGTPGPIGSNRVTSGRSVAIRTSRTGQTSEIIGRENLLPVAGSGQGGAQRSVLPTWYPRRPLSDITAVVRAVERRRERGRAGEGIQTEGPAIPDWMFQDPPSTPGALLEHDISKNPPLSIISKKCCSPYIGKVPKIFLNISHQNDEDSACWTPQKKLLNNIDTVEKVVMEELRKLKRTPSAKKSEREKRVRTLMSMR